MPAPAAPGRACRACSPSAILTDIAVATPDSLAGVPAVLAAAEAGEDLDGEAMLGIVWDAYRTKTANDSPAEVFRIESPSITFDWDFDDAGEMCRHLPRLARLYP
ncbi:DUF4240 domain-containing protein [Actinomadura algeriensis]|uniref:Uncharacterized protein n=1 Tax=Actinomadura algeriensis TaxID=1679523 RepID=A0ABR9K234_9ACTN|nr:hypothetical protein [Actinomadura algeriensis]MBE1536906.1 hypothetical protein [Actinomadura algeriensis]